MTAQTCTDDRCILPAVVLVRGSTMVSGGWARGVRWSAVSGLPELLCSFALGRGIYCTRRYRHTGDHGRSEVAAECRWCKTAIHDGDTCIECWRDRRALAIERDAEWWSA